MAKRLNPWPRATVVRVIKWRYLNDKCLNSWYVRKNCRRLWNSSKRYFSTWKKAVTASGIDYSIIYVSTGYGKWTKQTVIDAIKKRIDSGQSMRRSDMLANKELRSLYEAMVGRFGSLANAIESAGYDPDGYVKLYNWWTKERVTNKILLLQKKKEGINDAAISTNHKNLYFHALKLFGSWKKAVTASGIDYSIILLTDRGKWTKQTVIDAIKKRIDSGQSMSSPDMLASKESGSLFRAAVQKFGSLGKAIESAGYDKAKYIVVKDWWTKKKVINALRNRLERGLDLSKSAIQEEDPGLYYAALNLFESRKNALSAAGIDPDKFDKIRSWTKKQIINEIHRLRNNAESLSTAYVFKNYSPLWNAAKRRFGNWSKALIAAGYKPRKHIRRSSDSAWVASLSFKATQKILNNIEKMIEIEHKD